MNLYQPTNVDYGAAKNVASTVYLLEDIVSTVNTTGTAVAIAGFRRLAVIFDSVIDTSTAQIGIDVADNPSDGKWMPYKMLIKNVDNSATGIERIWRRSLTDTGREIYFFDDHFTARYIRASITATGIGMASSTFNIILMTQQ